MKTANLTKICFLLILVIHCALLAWSSWWHSPGQDEVAYLPAGIAHWRFGRFELYAANPPLVRMVAALPVLTTDLDIDWKQFHDDPAVRYEFSVGSAFVQAHGAYSFWLFTLARWACVPFSLLGGWVCFRWASDLFGQRSGLAAATLWCFCPNALAYGATILPDTASASCGALAGYAFWKWLCCREWKQAWLAGLALGVAQLAKSNWVILFVLWPLIWLLSVPVFRVTRQNKPRRIELVQLATMYVVAILLINLLYGFEGSFTKLGDFEFSSHFLQGADDRLMGANWIKKGNRFHNSWLGAIPVPLPKLYVIGIDVQRHSVETSRMSYLGGEWRSGGWWYYYLYATALKVPLGTWGLIIMACCVFLGRSEFRAAWRDELSLLLPVVAMLVFISSQAGVNHHFRYVLPIFPFIYIAVSRVFGQGALLKWDCVSDSRIHNHNSEIRNHIRYISCRCPSSKMVRHFLLSASIVSSLTIYPHSMSYFNLIAGGPMGGPRYLLGTNIDWGQDLLYLKSWLDHHSDARPIFVAFSQSHFVPPRVAGINAPEPPRGDTAPGWYAISVNSLFGQSGEWRHFLDREPDTKVGYSIYIYHVLSP